MFRRWFNPGNRLAHPEPQERLQAIRALSSEQALGATLTLVDLARSDELASIRDAALEKIENLDALADLLDEPQIADTVATRLAKAISAGHSCKADRHPLVVDARIRRAEGADVEALLPLLANEGQCAALALQVPDAYRQRVFDHALLQSESGLVALAKAAKGRDKRCHRYAKRKLEVIKVAQQRCTDSAGRLDEIDISINRALGNKPTDPRSLNNHHQHLLALRKLRETAVANFLQADAALTATGTTPNRYQLPQDPLDGLDWAKPPAPEDPYPPLVTKLEALAQRMFEGVLVDHVKADCEPLFSSWLSHADHYPPNQDQQAAFSRVSEQYQAYLGAWQRLDNVQKAIQQAPKPLPTDTELNTQATALLRSRVHWRQQWQAQINQIDWPSKHTPPGGVLDAHATLTQTLSEIARLQDLLADNDRKLTDAIKAADKALEQGQIELAKQHLQAARTLHKSGSHGHDRALAAVSARIAEFRDWQSFATNPKRAELIEQIKTLAEAPSEPTLQARHIKRLRSDWRQLGKPNNTQEFEQQRAFNALAEQAFEPCRLHYAAQEEQRVANLVARESLCEQLQTYLSATDWTRTDFKAAESILRNARSAWREHHPCDRTALKPVEVRFNALQDELHGKIKAHWDANLTLKRNIVTEAEALLSMDLPSQISGAKRLQQAWQQVGSTPRGPDQKLWRTFRKICDQIFQQRDVDQQAREADSAAQRTALEDAIAALETAAESTQPSQKTLSELNGSIDTLSRELSLNQALKTRIDKARDAYTASLSRFAKVQARAALDEWRAWDEQVSQAEREGTTIEAPHRLFSARLTGQAAPADWLNLVLEAEIAADKPSPPADQSARLALQIELMNAGRRDLAAEDYRMLLNRWSEAGPKNEQGEQLRTRFFDALALRL